MPEGHDTVSNTAVAGETAESLLSQNRSFREIIQAFVNILLSTLNCISPWATSDNFISSNVPVADILSRKILFIAPLRPFKFSEDISVHLQRAFSNDL